jgi:hypothetical protein
MLRIRARSNLSVRLLAGLGLRGGKLHFYPPLVCGANMTSTDLDYKDGRATSASFGARVGSFCINGIIKRAGRMVRILHGAEAGNVQTAHFHAELWMFMLFIWDQSRGFHINASLVAPYLASLRSLLKTSFVMKTVLPSLIEDNFAA